MNIDIITSILFGIFFLCFAVLTRKISTFANFSIGNKQLPLFLLFASISATFIGPGYSLGFIRKGYESGFLIFAFAIAYGIQTLLVGYFLAPKLQKFNNAYSIGDVVGHTHGKFAHILTGIISFGLLIAFSTVMANIGGTILSNFLHVSIFGGTVIMTSIVTVYSFFGGIKASILTDAFQFVLFVILFPLLLILMISSKDISISQLFNNSIHLTSSGIKSITPIGAIGLFVSFLLGETLLPPYINRALGAKTSKTARNAFMLSGLFFFIWLIIMLMIGIAGSSIINSDATDEIGLIISKRYFLPGFYGIFIISIVGIVMSSQDSLINSASSVFVRDVINIHVPLSENQSLVLSRLGTLIVGICSVAFSIYVPSVLDGLLWCYSIWAPSMLPILIASIILKKHSKLAGFLSIIIGATISIILKFEGIEANITTLWGVFFSTLSYVLFTFLNRKK